MPGRRAMVALMRRVFQDGNLAMIGWSSPPDRQGHWTEKGHFIGGPNCRVFRADRRAVERIS
ncbi:MAG: hypothetical protein ACP5U2_04440 [Bryobacteraceae bacterium]